MKKTLNTIQKIVTVLAVYKFKNVARICFTVLSSNGSDRYHVCFQGNGRESCDCPSKVTCYHLNQLRPRAQAYFESQKQQAPSHEGEGKLPQETRQSLYNWHQSQAGDEMEREYLAAEETRKANVRYMYNDL